MTITTKVQERIAGAFAAELSGNTGSRILCDGENAGLVDLYVYPPGRTADKQWELVVVVEIYDASVLVNGVGVHASVQGGDYEFVGTAGETEAAGVPAEILAIAEDMSARLDALNLPLVALEGHEAGMFADLHAIITARNAGDEAGLDDAILAAAERLSEILPHRADEFAGEPARGNSP